tara:strand:+ start:3344 stop:3535 length:192 start_codon:yes stop_codon:yes gene_type:complete
MEITKSQIKKIIKEEVARLTSEESSSKGLEMANSMLEQFQQLGESDRQVFLENFVKMVSEKLS